MSLLSWLRPARSALAPAPRRQRPATRRLMLEALETRDCPSGGLLDPTFGSGGFVNLPSTTSAQVMAVAVQPDGKVVAVGDVNSRSGKEEIAVQRLNPDGSFDTTFNGTGSVTIQTGSYDSSTSVALQPDGKILIGGAAASGNGTQEDLVARLDANGTLDKTFGNKGLWLYNAPYDVDKLAVLTDSTHTTVTGIVAATEVAGSVNGAQRMAAIKLTPAGALDNTFGSGGFAVLANPNGDGPETSVATDPLNGEIYLAGSVTSPITNYNTGSLAAFTPAGALDPAFGGGAGYVLGDPTGSGFSHFYDVAVQTLTVNGQSTSRILVAGDAGSLSGGPGLGIVYGYTSAGVLDATFGSSGTFSYAPAGTGYNTSFASLALEADGSIVVGGHQFDTATGYPEMLVGHLTANGTLDTSFGNESGFTVLQDGGIFSRVYGVAIDPIDGSILGCGFTDLTNNTTPLGVVFRLTAP